MTDWRQVVEELVAERSAEIEARLERFAVASLEVLVTALEARDPFMSGHSMRVAALSASLADAMGLDESQVEAVRLAGRLHDVGMMVISEQVVNRVGTLTEAERVQIRQHPVVGHQILLPYPHLREIARFIRGHHERWDGQGYPDALAGEAIPQGARIVAVVEVYDALVTSRSYRRDSLNPGEARAQMEALAGTALDPAVVRALSSVIGQKRTLQFLIDDAQSLAGAAPAAPAL
jgi:putative nucleotidyltransferase with HDIG domain